MIVICQAPECVGFYSENRNDFWAIIYSTFLLTASLDICDSQAARATAPDGLLPGYQPITDKLTVNRLSRHKVSRLIYDFGSRTNVTGLTSDPAVRPAYSAVSCAETALRLLLIFPHL